LLLAALGLMITFGLMKIINMAHGEFLMIGAYTTYCIQNLFLSALPAGAFDFYYIIALPASFIVSGLVGLVLEKLIISRLYGRPMDSLLVTWGVSLILQQLARNIFWYSECQCDFACMA
jgi:urea transport system permease protein